MDIDATERSTPEVEDPGPDVVHAEPATMLVLLTVTFKPLGSEKDDP
jgi:hypothetical protein